MKTHLKLVMMVSFLALTACNNHPQREVVVIDKSEIKDGQIQQLLIVPSETQVIALDKPEYAIEGHIDEVYQDEDQIVSSENNAVEELTGLSSNTVINPPINQLSKQENRRNFDDNQVNQTKKITPRVAIVLPAEEALLNGAVKALVQEANKNQQQGNLQVAALRLERAQRIAPREPYVLYQLAGLRLMQNDPAAAEQIATKALGYASNRLQMQAGLWKLISQCRLVRGDHAGAVAAQEQAMLGTW